MKKQFFFVGLVWITAFFSQAQNVGNVKGTVYTQGKPLPFASIGLKNTKWGTVSDTLGRFQLFNVPVGRYELMVNAVGYQSQQHPIEIDASETVEIDFYLEEHATLLTEVVVTGTMREVSQLNSPVPTEVLSASFLQKIAAPSLLDGLQAVNGIRGQLTCAVCNTATIRINGMDGAYTMVLIDGMPIVSGLATVYGLNGIPTSMIERIEVVKGPTAVLYGSEAIGGLINIITKQPHKSPTFSIDLQSTTFLENTLSVSLKNQGKKAASLWSADVFHFANPLDKNGDGFVDGAQQKRVSLFNKWTWQRKEHRLASLAGRYVYEDRWGGQTHWNKTHRGKDDVYGESIYTTRYELLGQYQLPIASEKIVFSSSFNTHLQNAAYGTTFYLAHQHIGFGQLLWEKTLGKHPFLLGTTLRYTHYDDNTPATEKPSRTWLPGIFAQNEFLLHPNSSLMLGIRYDYHSVHKHIVTPRLNVKFSPNHHHTLRLSAGTGFRVVNLFTEDHAALTGAREVVLKSQLQPEKSYNVNFNYQRYIHLPAGFINLETAVFYTYFTNKIIADYQTHPNQIIYDNLKGYAVSRGISFSADVQFLQPLTLNVGTTLLDVFQKQENDKGLLEKQPIPFAERFSANFSVTYHWQKLGCKIDYTGNVYGHMPLPRLSDLDERPAYSPIFSLQHLKISKEWRNGCTLYGGIRNILNFTPPANAMARSFDPFDRQVVFDENGRVIPTPDNPQALTFDTAYVYASFLKRSAFLGISWKIK